MSTLRSRSMVRTAARMYFAPLIAIGGLALIVFILGVLAIATQLLAFWVRHLAH